MKYAGGGENPIDKLVLGQGLVRVKTFFLGPDNNHRLQIPATHLNLIIVSR